MDCNGDCCDSTPNEVAGCGAKYDDCGVCSGGNTQLEPNDYTEMSLWVNSPDIDCMGQCSPSTPVGCTEGAGCGTALIDNCDICSGGLSDHVANSDKDCNEDCFGDATLDNCDVCSGGYSGHVADSDIDCWGDCGQSTPVGCTGEGCGTALLDTCGVCNGPGETLCWDGSMACDADNCPAIEAPDFFHFNQSTQQAFYYFLSATIDSNELEAYDWVGALIAGQLSASHAIEPSQHNVSPGPLHTPQVSNRAVPHPSPVQPTGVLWPQSPQQSISLSATWPERPPEHSPQLSNWAVPHSIP
jgi:hypothetical protein